MPEVRCLTSSPVIQASSSPRAQLLHRPDTEERCEKNKRRATKGNMFIPRRVEPVDHSPHTTVDMHNWRTTFKEIACLCKMLSNYELFYSSREFIGVNTALFLLCTISPNETEAHGLMRCIILLNTTTTPLISQHDALTSNCWILALRICFSSSVRSPIPLATFLSICCI